MRRQQQHLQGIHAFSVLNEERTELVKLFQTVVHDKLLEHLCNGGSSARRGQRARDMRGTAREFDLEYEPQSNIATMGIGCLAHATLNGSMPDGVGRHLPVL
ncbi:hypothetical protein, partial [Paraburkholderia hospita]|uniref:hypothetical protein n=1 Tax=Paraburkholderia hospita TaxID=169430 RepID=UPI001EE66945